MARPFTTTMRAFLLTRFETVEDVYGSSETNKSFSNRNTLVDGALHRVGQPADSDLEIVDDAGQPVAPGVLGVVRGPQWLLRSRLYRPARGDRARFFAMGGSTPAILPPGADNGTPSDQGPRGRGDQPERSQDRPADR